MLPIPGTKFVSYMDVFFWLVFCVQHWNSVFSLPQLKKIQEKADKCRRDVEIAKEKYEATLNDLNAYNAKYMEDMTEVS